MPAAYRKMYDAIQRTGRPMVYSLCQYGMRSRLAVGAGSRRQYVAHHQMTSGATTTGFRLFGFQQDGLEKFVGPGHWNDPDILQIGVGKLNNDEGRTQMTLWCILAAPLLAGNDLTKMTKETLEILTNPEVIAVDQDRLGVQGHRVWQEGPLEVWMKPLADGSTAVGLFNRSDQDYPFQSRSKRLEPAIPLASATYGLGKTSAFLRESTRRTCRDTAPR